MRRSHLLVAASFASVLVLLASSAWGISPRVAVCTPAAAAPVIDGKLNDACWKTAGVATDFLLDSGEGLPANRTTAKLCFDKDFLYIGVEGMENDWDTVKSLIRDHDGHVDQDDDIEIFFDPACDRKSYMHFMFNMLGTRADLMNGSEAWDCDWKVAIDKQADRWTAEVAIPLKALGGAKLGDTWGFNIGRGQPLKKAYASFACITGKWGNASAFATLKFAAESKGEGSLFAAGAEGVQTFALPPEQGFDLVRLPKPGEEYLNAFGTPGETVPYTFHALNLEAKTPAVVSIAATPFTGPAGTLDVPESAFLVLNPKLAGGPMWDFIGPGREITVQPGQRGGFWLDFTAPADAKPGLYTSKVTLTINGKGRPATQERTVKLLVLPFTLDANPCSCGFHYPKDRTPEQVRESLKLMRENGMTTFAPYGNWGGSRGVGDYVKLHDEFGFTGKLIYADDVMYIGDRLAGQMGLPHRGPKLRDSNRTWEINDEYKKRYVAEVRRFYDAAKAAGRPDVSFSIGDELTSDGFYGAQHLIDRARALREGLPEANLTSDIIGYKEALGAAHYLNAIGINDGWSGPDNHNGNIRLINTKVLGEIKALGCKPELVNMGMGRYPFGFYLWRMTNWGIASKIEWIWSSERFEPAWLNIWRNEGKTWVTVALKQSRSGTYDARYAATLDALAKKAGDAKAAQLLADITSRIAVEDSHGEGWTPERCDAARWMIAKEIMRLKGSSVGVAANAAALAGEFKAAPAWETVALEKKFVRHVSRTFAAAPVTAAPVLDGKLDDACWKNAQVVRGAYNDTDLSLVEGMMDVRAVYTDQGLYLGITSHEPAVAKMSFGSRGNEDSELWQVDDMEIFVDPARTGDYFQLVFDAKGTKTDYKGHDIKWNGEWQVKCRLDGDTWTAEAFLPFETFGGKDKPWGIFVGRGSPTRNEYYGIAPIKGNWSDTKQFATLEFAAPKPYVDSVDFSRLEVGKNTVAVVVTNPTAAKVSGRVWLTYPGGASSEEVKDLAPGATAKTPLDFSITSPGEHPIEVKFVGPAEAAFDRESFVARVDELMTASLAPESVFSGVSKRTLNVAFNIPKEKLKDYALTVDVAGAKQTLALAGNRGAVTLDLPTLKEGKYAVTVSLGLANGTAPATAEKKLDFFVTHGPAY